MSSKRKQLNSLNSFALSTWKIRRLVNNQDHHCSIKKKRFKLSCYLVPNINNELIKTQSTILTAYFRCVRHWQARPCIGNVRANVYVKQYLLD